MSFSNEQIVAEQLPRYEAVTLERLPKESMVVGMITWLIILFISLCVITVLKFLNVPLFQSGLLYWVIGYIVVFGLGCLFLRLSYLRKGYAVREHDITFKSGIIWHKRIVLPFNRVQHVETHQGVLQRKFQLAKLQLFTAGGIRADMTINGLNFQVSERIKSSILNRLEYDKADG